MRTERDVTAYIQSRPERPACVLLYAPLESELPKIPTDQSCSCQWLDRFFFVHMSARPLLNLNSDDENVVKLSGGTNWAITLFYDHTHTHTDCHCLPRLSLASPFFSLLFSIRARPILSPKACVWRIFILTCFLWLPGCIAAVSSHVSH